MMKKSISQTLLFLFPMLLFGVQVELENPRFAEELSGWKHRLDDTRAETVAVEGQAFDTALRLTVDTKPEKPWFVQIRQPLDEKIFAAEQVEVSAMMRSPGGSAASLALQLGERPFTPLIFNRFTLTPEWQQVTVRGKLDQSLEAGKGVIVLTCGFGVGVVELSDVRVRFPERDELSDVPESFKALSWKVEDLPVLDVQSHPGVEGQALPPGPHRSLIEGVGGFTFQGPELGNMSRIAVTGQHFTEAVRMETTGVGKHIYSVQLMQDLLYSVQKGDTLLALFSYRVHRVNAETGYGATQFALEKKGGRYEKLLSWGVAAEDGDWHHVVLPLTLDSDLAAGSAQVVVRGGYGPQVIDIGGVSLIHFGPEVSAADLPKSRMEYLGSSPEAAWREQAGVRIEKYRKGDFSLKLTDANGKPLPGLRVTGKLTRHAYGFGSTLANPVLLPGTWRHHAEYGKMAAELFNAGSLENAMKWKRAYFPKADEQMEAGIRWMEEQNFRIRGHTLVWPGWRYSPQEIAGLRNQPEALRAAILERIETLGTRYAGRIQDWDVINEPYSNHDYMDLLGMEEMERWMQAARKADPHAKLFINDFDLLTRPGTGNPKLGYYLDLIARFQKNDIPLDGIGLQSHFKGSLTPIPHVVDILDTFYKAGVDVQITELTVNIPDEQTQAAYVRDFITAVFSHPSTDLVQTWGFWEGFMFEPEAAMFRKDWSSKPLADAFRDLVFETWTTRVDAVTDANGEIQFRGFYGDYSFETPAHATGTGLPVTFDADGTRAVLEL